MIGQEEVIAKLKTTKARSVLLTGPAHWGKKTLLRELFQKTESVYEITGNAAVFRETIDRIYQTVRPTIYLIPDIDRCNATIQNVLLKVLEEPPKSARFFLTASGAVLPTIVSRCVVYRMEPYDVSVLSHLEATSQIRGMFHSPGERFLLDVPGIENIIHQMDEVKLLLTNRATLAAILKKVREFNRVFQDSNLTQDAFLLLAHGIYGENEALDWLRSQPQDAVKYVRTAYFMKLWLEMEVSRS